jgi:hypothetical protein
VRFSHCKHTQEFRKLCTATRVETNRASEKGSAKLDGATNRGHRVFDSALGLSPGAGVFPESPFKARERSPN